jgi:hypothetical protein
MKKLRFPLWLVCDSRAFVRLWLSLAVFGLVQRNLLSGRNAARLSLDAAARLIMSMCACESLLRWAILRRAFRLLGLDVAAVRFVQIEPALTPTAWRCRRQRLFATLHTLNACARRQASRIRRALEREAGQAAKPMSLAAPAALLASLPSFVLRVPSQPWTRGIPAPP